MKIVFFTTILTLSIVVGSFSQNQSPNQTREELIRKQQTEENIRDLNERINAQISENNKPSPHPPMLAEFLPDNPENTWAIGVVQYVGWSKVARIKAVVKSDGNFLCQNDNFEKNRLVSTGKFEFLSNLIDNNEFFKLKNDRYLISTCNQCTSNWLVLLRKREITTKKNKKQMQTESYVFNLKDHDTNLSPVRRIYDAALTSATCE